jgi:hypothetical protein
MTDKINKYIAEVLFPILKNYVPSMNSQSGEDSGKTVITAFGSALKNTMFHHSVADAPLIHYTSLDKAKRILADGFINLSSLKASNDKNEISKNFGYISEFTFNPESVNFIKDNTLNLSLTTFNEKSINDNYEAIIHNFIEFGDEFPIGFVLDLSENNQDEWFTYHLVKVNYYEHVPELLNEISIKTRKWIDKHKFQITDIQDALIPILACYKEKKYEIENEIRLMCVPLDSNNHLNHHTIFNGNYLNDNLERITTQRLYFNKQVESNIINSLREPQPFIEYTKKTTPNLLLKKIILPYRRYPIKLKDTDKIIKSPEEIRHAFWNLLDSIGLDCKVEFIDFDDTNKTIQIII